MIGNRENSVSSEFLAKERILIVEVNWLGDVLFSTPAIRAVRERHPGAYIAALVVPRCKEVLFGNNYLDEVMVLDEKGRHKGLRGIGTLIGDIKLRRFTIVYLFHKSFTRTLCCFLAGIKKRIGYYTKKRGFLLTEKVVLPKEEFHRADTFYYLVTKSKIPEGERYCDFFISSEDKNYIDDFLKKHNLGMGKKIVVGKLFSIFARGAHFGRNLLGRHPGIWPGGKIFTGFRGRRTTTRDRLVNPNAVG